MLLAALEQRVELRDHRAAGGEVGLAGQGGPHRGQEVLLPRGWERWRLLFVHAGAVQEHDQQADQQQHGHDDPGGDGQGPAPAGADFFVHQRYPQ
jgi:hypothetical protein